jgi:hypothetical protein
MFVQEPEELYETASPDEAVAATVKVAPANALVGAPLVILID